MPKIETIRHSIAHLAAGAVQELYPGTKFAIGPVIENGFYYDFDLPKKIAAEDLPRIEKKIKELINQEISFKKRSLSKAQAKKLFKDQPYKLELIKDIENKNVSIYQSKDFIDLCKGPHVRSSREISEDAFKLTKVAGAYWKGDEKNPMLTRIYGVAFNNKKQLKDYLKQQAEAEKRDHRILGQKLEIFIFDQQVGAGLPLWLPKGTTLRKIIKDYLYQELVNEGYEWIETPHIGKLDLWETSGHWKLYRENIYSPIDIEKDKYVLKPMNCPFHVKIYQSKIRSYCDLPIKYSEIGTVYRYERSGTLHGLTRVRGFSQDDAHVICQPGQLLEEVTKLTKYALKTLETFGFKDCFIYLSTRPEKYAGTPKDWAKATDSLKQVLKKLKLDYRVDPGGGVPC